MFRIIITLSLFAGQLEAMARRPAPKKPTALPALRTAPKKPSKPQKSDLIIDPHKDVLPEMVSPRKKRLASELSPILDNEREIDEAVSNYFEMQKIIIDSLEHLQEYPLVPYEAILQSLRNSRTFLPTFQKKLTDLLAAVSLKIEVTHVAFHNFLEQEIIEPVRALKQDSSNNNQRGQLVEPIEKFLNKLREDRRIIEIYKNRFKQQQRKKFAAALQQKPESKEESKQTVLPAIRKYQAET